MILSFFVKQNILPLKMGYNERFFFNTVDPPTQGRTFFEHSFRPYRLSLTTKIFPLKMLVTARGRTVDFIEFLVMIITILLTVRRLLRNYL